MKLRSMTGFAAVEGRIRGQRFRAEIRSLNHRFLDLKVRLPKSLASLEHKVRPVVERFLDRGSVDLKIESLPETADVATEYRVNRAVVGYYHAEAKALQQQLGIKGEVRIEELLSLPEAITRGSGAIAENETPEALWPDLESLIRASLEKALEMRENEGGALRAILESGLGELDGHVARLKHRRGECQEAYKADLAERIRAVFEAHPITEGGAKAVLESRIAQELAIILERTDIAEELDRFTGHLAHLRKVLSEGSPAGRRLEFLLQEINREVNTLGNKAQDLAISEDVVQVKVLLEQLREQSLNLE